jgi:hypothetical protein
MLRLVSITLALIVITSMTSGGMVALGRAQPPLFQADVPEIAVCDGQPCFDNVVVGVNTIVDVYPLLPESIAKLRAGTMMFSPQHSNMQGGINWDEQTQVVTRIILTLRQPNAPSPLPTLRELILLYGEPCTTQPNATGSAFSLLTVMFPHVWARFSRRDGIRLTLGSRPNMIVFETVQENLCTAPSTEYPPRQSWRGIAAFRRYRP